MCFWPSFLFLKLHSPEISESVNFRFYKRNMYASSFPCQIACAIGRPKVGTPGKIRWEGGVGEGGSES